MSVIPQTQPVHVPANNTRQGWGVALLVVAITLAADFGAYMIHKATYRNPVHPSATVPNTDRSEH
jgi:hypothetical protein